MSFSSSSLELVVIYVGRCVNEVFSQMQTFVRTPEFTLGGVTITYFS